ncbi:TolC family protein [Massilia forsythiae]|uniref:TolC family protein n=1 Tax=Massilia forsythiae TaxID=2728020 RepID=A0A7Z2ZUE2_9BURK|nr:TolC family protein [Massilia forsythiae]QJE02334.1 TolC family protein [Massilia forsythiae]
MHALIKPSAMLAMAIVSACAAAADPAASASAAIDLRAAIRLALEQPGVRAAIHEAAAGDAEAAQAGRYPNPTLSFLREGQRAGSSTSTLQLDQPIELGGKRRARIMLAESAAALAHGELAALRRTVRADVAAAFHALLAARDRQALAKALAEVARQGVDVAAKRVAAGKAAPLDETRARLAALDAAGAVRRADGELAIARTRLGALIGRPADAIEPVAPADGLPAPPPLSVLLARVEDAAPVRRARGRLALQGAQAGVARAARIPDLTLSVGSQREDQAGEFDGRVGARRQAVIGLSVPLPLFDRRSDALAAALRRQDQARDELEAARVEAGAALAAAHARIEQARAEAALLRDELVPQARAAYELTLKGFEYGKFSFLDVLDAQRTWHQAQLRRSDAVLEAWRAMADIERLAGDADPQ